MGDVKRVIGNALEYMNNSPRALSAMELKRQLEHLLADIELSEYRNSLE